MSSENVLTLEQVTVGHGGAAVLSGLDLSIDKGQVVALMGRNGVGKTTTLSTIAGLVKPISGDIQLHNERLRGPLHARVRRGLGLVTEERAVIRQLTVDENLRVGGGGRADVYELFPELEQLRDRRAGLLSGGEQQMLALGRTLAARPTLLLVDELSFGLAPQIVGRLITVLAAAAASGSAILLVEPQPEVALKIATYGYVLGRGEVLLQGTRQELWERADEVQAAYLALKN